MERMSRSYSDCLGSMVECLVGHVLLLPCNGRTARLHGHWRLHVLRASITPSQSQCFVLVKISPSDT